MGEGLTFLKALILGFVQGVTEFLPVSSSGHLVLLQKIFGIDDGGLLFSCMLHVGSLIAVFVVFFKDIRNICVALFGGFFKAVRTKNFAEYGKSFGSGSNKLFVMLVIATIPTVLMALLMDGLKIPALGDRTIIEYTFSGMALGWAFLITAAILIAAELRRGGERKLRDMTPAMAAFIGLMQGVAIMPAVSRSGSTIAGGVFVGLDRKLAARFSLLLSIPAILGSFVLELRKAAAEGLADQPWLIMLAGVLMAALAGLVAIKLLLKALERAGLLPFAAYVTLLGIYILCDQYILHIFF